MDLETIEQLSQRCFLSRHQTEKIVLVGHVFLFLGVNRVIIVVPVPVLNTLNIPVLRPRILLQLSLLEDEGICKYDQISSSIHIIKFSRD
jgi:hypothetical protein